MSAEASAGTRKTVTVLFCDVSGSTELAGRLDPEALHRVMESYFARVSEVLVSHGGTVEKYIGDAVVAVFGVPVAHEDDALRSCRAGLEVLAALAGLGEEVQGRYGVGFAARIGVETGEVLAGDPSRGSTFATGAAVNTAARLEQVASSGEILLGPVCHRLVRDRVVAEPRHGVVLKGVPEPLDAFALLGVVAPGEVAAPRSTYVGRERELALLGQGLDRARVDRTVQVVTILGVAGMGKSRLAEEFLSGLHPEVQRLSGRCMSYGHGATYGSLVEVARQAAALSGAESAQETRDGLLGVLGESPDAGEVADRVAALCALDELPAPPADTAWAVRRLLEELSRDRPVVMVIDDLHWAQPSLVVLVDDVCQWLLDSAVLVVLLARPEFLDDHPSWGGGRSNTFSAMLEPLAAGDVEAMVDDVLGAPPEAAMVKVRQLAGGNPLYIEHLLAMLVEDGVLRHTPDGWVLHGDIEQITAPGSITALIAARLDRLPPDERRVLCLASVMGQTFYRDALPQLGADEGPAALLAALARKGLLRPASSELPGQAAQRFAHVLVRDAAYAVLPKATRADLHERCARWLDGNASGRAVDDQVGAHLEAAHLAWTELGGQDDAAHRLGEEAADRLEKAGRRLLFADDTAACVLLERADRLRDGQGPDRWALQRDLVAAWRRNQDRLADSRLVAGRMRAAAEEAGHRGFSLQARLLDGMIQLDGGTDVGIQALRECADEALGYFAESADDDGLVLTHLAIADVSYVVLDLGDCTRHLELAAVHAARAGQAALARVLRGQLILFCVFGDCPAERGLEQTRRALEESVGRQERSVHFSELGLWNSLLGHDDEAEEAWGTARRLAEDISSLSAVMDVLQTRAAACLATGRWHAAAQALREVCAHHRDVESWAYLSTFEAWRATALLHLGMWEEARLSVEAARSYGATTDVATHAAADAADAWLAAVDGDETEARALVERAVHLLPAPVLLVRALVHVACAEAMLVLGDREQAQQHRRTAVELYERKGDLVGAAHQRTLLEQAG